MADDDQKDLYFGQDGYDERILESGQVVEIGNNVFSLGFDLATSGGKLKNTDISNYANLASSFAKAKDDDEAVKRGVVSSSLGLMEKQLEFCNDGLKTFEDLEWEDFVSNLPKSSRCALTLKITNAYDKLSAGIKLFDSLCQAIIHLSPVDELIKKPFFGDWGAITGTSEQWGAIAQQLVSAKQTLLGVQSIASSGGWEGKARDCFDERIENLADAVQIAVDPSRKMQSALELLSSIVENALDLIISAIDQIIGLLELLMGECSFGPLGWAVATVTAASKAYDVYNLYCDARDMVEKVSSFLSDFQNATANIANALIDAKDIRDLFPN